MQCLGENQHYDHALYRRQDLYSCRANGEMEQSRPGDTHTVTFGTEPANPVPPSSNLTVDADGRCTAQFFQRRQRSLGVTAY
jgi:hypothetical protein